jgi:methionyl-tRNA formyltransferase
MTTNNIRFAFFGTSHIARYALEEIVRAGYTPELVITAPDAPQGRGLTLTPSEISQWADAQHIPLHKPEHISESLIRSLQEQTWDVFVVVDYGYILPQALLSIPRRGVLNIHPSLLPRLRGPSPIRSAILDDERETGVSVMLMDAKMDHGPIIAQKNIRTQEWPPRVHELEETLARAGGALLAEVLPLWIDGAVEARDQEHARATYCTLIKKEDGLIDIHGDPYANLLKIRAYEGWPGTFAFFERNGARIRVKICDARLTSDGTLSITRVIPEGKREMSYEDFLRSGAHPATPTASAS